MIYAAIVRMALLSVSAVALPVADVWTGLVIFNAVTGSNGHGAVFWTAVALLVVILLALLWLTRWTSRRLAAQLGRPSAPSG